MVVAIAPTVVLPAASLLLYGAAPALHSWLQLGPVLEILDAHEQRLLGERQGRSDDPERERAALRGPRCEGPVATRTSPPRLQGASGEVEAAPVVTAALTD